MTSDQEIHKLNRCYRGKNKPTDVLSFPAFCQCGIASGKAIPHLGDIVVSLDTAERQAIEQGVELGAEVLRLLIHGVLHLLGYDHEGVSRAEAKKMFDAEAVLYSKWWKKLQAMTG